MLHALIPTLIVSVATGLAFLAYKHPPAYRLIFTTALVAGTVLFIGFTSWNIGVDRGCLNAAKLAQPTAWPNFMARCEASEVPYVTTVWFCVVAYLFFLAYLPKLISLRDENKSDSHKE